MADDDGVAAAAAALVRADESGAAVSTPGDPFGSETVCASDDAAARARLRQRAHRPRGRGERRRPHARLLRHRLTEGLET
jgi:hypothetical protein